LRSRYGLAKTEILAALSALLDTVELQFEDVQSIEAALYSWKNSIAEFADCLIDARHHTLGCRTTSKFDSKASKLAGFTAV
jgi:predicted nucleic-acid-binding protein